jgi:hypothetical protein
MHVLNVHLSFLVAPSYVCMYILRKRIPDEYIICKILRYMHIKILSYSDTGKSCPVSLKKMSLLRPSFNKVVRVAKAE